MRRIEHRSNKERKEAYNTQPKSSDKYDIIEWLAHTDFVVNYVQKLAYNDHKDLVDDMTQEIWLILLETPQERWDDIYNQGIKHII